MIGLPKFAAVTLIWVCRFAHELASSSWVSYHFCIEQVQYGPGCLRLFCLKILTFIPFLMLVFWEYCEFGC